MGGVSVQRAGLAPGHVGHQVEAVSTGHAAQPLENLSESSPTTTRISRRLPEAFGFFGAQQACLPRCRCVCVDPCTGSSSPAAGRGWSPGSQIWTCGCS